MGYDEPERHEVHIEAALPEETAEAGELIADFAIGLTDKLPIRYLRVDDLRFNIPKTLKDERNLVGAILQFRDGPPSVGATTLAFSNRAQTRTTSLPFETYVAKRVFPFLTDDRSKVRFSSRLVSVVATPRTNSMTIRFDIPDYEPPVPLNELSAAGQIIELFAKADEEGIIVTYSRNGTEMTIGYRNDAPLNFLSVRHPWSWPKRPRLRNLSPITSAYPATHSFRRTKSTISRGNLWPCAPR